MAHGGVPYEERAFTEQDMLAADEVWITSSTKEILPVTRINEQVVTDGRAGPLFKQVHALFQRYKADYRRAPAA
jgi:D-alanine transaminase